MKKLFTLTMLALLGFATSADAQNYRKWDFTNWSAQTVADLNEEAKKGQLDGSWSDIEKKDAGATTPGGGVCFWSYGDNVSEDGYLMANGKVIAETEGLVFNTGYTTRRSLALAVDYPSTSLGEYAGPQYLWLGGGNAKSAGARIACFTIPNVRIGQKMKFTVESHKPAEARGVSLFVGDCTNDANQIGESFKPTTLQTYTWEEGWTLPEGATDNGDGTVNVVVYNTNGCHIYSIEVGEDDEKSTVAYLYEGSTDNEKAYNAIAGNDKYFVEPILAINAFTLEELQSFDAIVISSTIENTEALASLKAIRPFIPTLNLNASVYQVWGVGKVVNSEQPFALVTQPNHALFRGLEESGSLIVDPDNEDVKVLHVTDADNYSALYLANEFADDAVLATVYGNDEQVAIHGHSLSRNAYIYLPLDQVALSNGADPTLLANAITVVANTKAKVAQAPAPSISQEFKNRMTIVTLKSTAPMAEIFYTIDGSEPTEASTLYTEPFEVSSEGVTVKAVARGEGFLLSDGAEQAIEIKTQAAAPTVNVDGNIVTITTDVPDATIYYNYSGSNEIKKSSPYTEPVTVKRSCTISAFVAAEGMLNSEVTSAEVTVEGSKVRTNILAHMDANKEEYFEKGDQNKSSTSYYFSWRKDKAAYSYYNEEAGYTEETVTDPDSGDETTVRTYNEMNPEEEVDFENGWIIRSRGQLVIWEGLAAGTDIGDTSNRNPATVEDINPDFPVTSNFINLADKNTMPSDATFPYNAYIVSKDTFKGPFDIVANIGNGNGSDNTSFYIVLQTSKDGNKWESEWQTAGDTVVIQNGYRLYHNFTRSYNGTDEVYVRAYLAGGNSKAQFYDIYIANNPDEEAGPSIKGDVNGDNVVDVADISAIISVMAGTANYDFADVNGDGSVDVADISNVISIMAQ